MQIMRFSVIAREATITKLLGNNTPDLPDAVAGIVRIKGISSASVILRLLPTTGTSTGYIITPDGDILLTPDGNHVETPDYA